MRDPPRTRAWPCATPSFLYEIEIRDGAPRKATRTASDGSYQRGERVLASMLGVGAGRFVVSPTRTSRSAARSDGGTLGGVSSRAPSPCARGALAATTGARTMDVERIAARSTRRLDDYLRATPEPARAIIGRLARGASPRQMLLGGEVVAEPRSRTCSSDLAARGAIGGVRGTRADRRRRSTPAVEAALAPSSEARPSAARRCRRAARASVRRRRTMPPAVAAARSPAAGRVPRAGRGAPRAPRTSAHAERGRRRRRVRADRAGAGAAVVAGGRGDARDQRPFAEPATRVRRARRPSSSRASCARARIQPAGRRETARLPSLPPRRELSPARSPARRLRAVDAGAPMSASRDRGATPEMTALDRTDGRGARRAPSTPPVVCTTAPRRAAPGPAPPRRVPSAGADEDDEPTRTPRRRSRARAGRTPWRRGGAAADAASRRPRRASSLRCSRTLVWIPSEAGAARGRDAERAPPAGAVPNAAPRPRPRRAASRTARSPPVSRRPPARGSSTSRGRRTSRSASTASRAGAAPRSACRSPPGRTRSSSSRRRPPRIARRRAASIEVRAGRMASIDLSAP